ncbi:hypothetical protein [Bacillus sp. OAE603]|uniref:hypothetical protein n=1 Tax=Gottfriedia sp. OAE603 TaxID=2663872 RepID=UPI00178B645F
MKNYFIRLIFGLLTFAFIVVLSKIFKIEIFNSNHPSNHFITLLLVLAGGWGGWFFYKLKKEQK